jgi:hypothetical protein
MLEDKLNPKNFGLAVGIVWGGGLLVWTLIASNNGWGAELLELLGTAYRGLEVTPQGAVTGGIWGFVDGFIGGYLIAWVYNKLQTR